MKQKIARPFDRRVCERLEKLQSKRIAARRKEICSRCGQVLGGGIKILHPDIEGPICEECYYEIKGLPYSPAKPQNLVQGRSEER